MMTTSPSDKTSLGPVVVVASTGFVVRNYLLGACLAQLQVHRKVVVLSPLAKDPDFVDAMKSRGTDVELLLRSKVDGGWGRARRWRSALHAAALDNETWKLKRTDEKRAAVPGRTLGRAQRMTLNISSMLVALGLGLAGRRALDLADTVERRLALQSPQADEYRRLFARLRPSLVFAPAPVQHDEWLPIQVARAHGIRAALGVLSWDNLSSKARLPLPANAVLVWSEAMRDELLAYYPRIVPAMVHVTGAPQFDYYKDPRYLRTREDFLPSIGVDPRRPLVVYAGVTPSLMPDEPNVVEALAVALRQGRVTGSPQLHVRLHPKDDGRRYLSVRARYPEVTFTTPGERSSGDLARWKPSDDDLALLVNTVRHGDVHINVASTMMVDAAVVDRPVINVNYDIRPPGSPRSWGLRVYEYTHYLPLLRTGGFRTAHDPDELVALIGQYLADPTLDRDGRRRVVDLVCGTADGRAGHRTGECLIELSRP